MFVNGKRTEGSIRELTDSLHQDPLGLPKRIRFGLPTGEGAPQGLRGWGVRLMGSRGRFPLVGSDKVRDFLSS